MAFFGGGLWSSKWFPWVAGGLGMLALFLAVSGSDKSTVPITARGAGASQAKQADQGLYDIKIGSWQNRVDQDLEARRREISEMQRGQEEIARSLKQITESLAEVREWKEKADEKELTVEEVKQMPTRIPQAQGDPGVGITVYRFHQQSKSSGLPQHRQVAKSYLRTSRLTAFVPGGSMARSVLLTGVDAPVGGKPFPVLLTLTDAFIGPNSYRIPLKGCLALGKAEGNASSERADIQIVRISCVLVGGKAFEQEASGYLVGADGKQGIPGRLVDKEARKIAFAAAAGIGEGLARAFSQQEVTNVVTDSGAVTSAVTGDAARFAMASGAEGAAEEVRDYYEKQAERFIPVVEVDAGQKVTMILLSGVSVPGLGSVANVDPIRGID